MKHEIVETEDIKNVEDVENRIFHAVQSKIGD